MIQMIRISHHINPEKKREENVGIAMEAAMPGKLKTYQCRRPCGKESDNRKSKHACIVEAHESTRERLERIRPKDHEDGIAGKGFNSLSHHDFAHNLIAMSSNENPGAVDKEWEKFEKLPAWQINKVKSKKSHPRITKRAKNGPFCYAGGHLSSQECGVGTEIWKYKGRLVLRDDTVKDDSGSYVVFTEQESSASQMTAARVVNVIAMLQGCGGQAADAVKAYTQVTMEDAPTLLKIPESDCPLIWIRLPRPKWTKSSSNIEDPVVPFERNLYGHQSGLESHPASCQSWRIHFRSMFRYRETCCEVIKKDSRIFQVTFEWVMRAKMLVIWARFLLDNMSWQAMT